MSKQVGQYGGGYKNYDYDYSDDFSYNPSQGQEVLATIGYLEVVDCEEDNNQMSSYEQSWRSHDRNRQTGSYMTTSTKAVASRGETFKERSTGRVGAKDEFKTTSTYRVGDKSGYTEYQKRGSAESISVEAAAGLFVRGERATNISNERVW